MDREKAAESESEGEGTHNYAPYLGFVGSFFSPYPFFYSFTLCTFNKSENVSVWFKSNKAVDDLCQEVAREKSEARFERQFQGSEASINLSYLYRISFEWLLN